MGRCEGIVWREVKEKQCVCVCVCVCGYVRVVTRGWAMWKLAI